MVLPNKPAYHWYGGKAIIADEVWQHIGNTDNYVEPFLGGGAVLLARPGGAGTHETINDLDGQVVNFWRATRSEAERVAELACDLAAEVNLLATNRLLYDTRDLVSALLQDVDFYDVHMGAQWLFGQRLVIGPGWSLRPNATQFMPRAGRIPTVEGTLTRLLAIRERIRHVRVLCGGWDRALKSKTNTTSLGVTGVFLDPPYLPLGRSTGLYYGDAADNNVALAVREWALSHGDDPKFRIAMCGYVFEHDGFFPPSWSRFHWRANGGLANIGRGEGRERAGQECVWFSPHCL